MCYNFKTFWHIVSYAISTQYSSYTVHTCIFIATTQFICINDSLVIRSGLKLNFIRPFLLSLLDSSPTYSCPSLPRLLLLVHFRPEFFKKKIHCRFLLLCHSWSFHWEGWVCYITGKIHHHKGPTILGLSAKK